MGEDRYCIKSDYGYGDWSYPYENLTAEEVIAWFNDRTSMGFTTIKECMNHDDPIYSLHYGAYGERNEHWMDS
jgi:hypothetical protein